MAHESAGIGMSLSKSQATGDRVSREAWSLLAEDERERRFPVPGQSFSFVPGAPAGGWVLAGGSLSTRGW